MSRETGEPRHGDLLIARDRSDRGGFVLGTVPGPAQIRYRTFDQALATAGMWAAQQGVAVWSTDDGSTFVRVEQRRGSPAPPEGPLARSPQPGETRRP